MPLAPLVAPLLAGRDLDQAEAAALAKHLFDDATEGEIGSALTLLAMKGPSGTELAAFAAEMRGRAHQVRTEIPDLVDTCGTGGGRSSFNLSTAAALIAAGAGVKIAKHGNRAVTSLCGSADVLEELGVTLSADLDDLTRRLREHGIAFLFAPHHHPAMAKVGPVRRALGFRTIFNALGPLMNPAGARRCVVGVYAPELVRPVAEALGALGNERAYVVHGEEILDEVSPCGPTRWARVDGDRITEGRWTPDDFGFAPLDFDALSCGGTRAEAAAIVREAVTDPDSPRHLAALPTAAVAIMLDDKAETFAEAAALGTEAVRSGAAARKLEELAS